MNITKIPSSKIYDKINQKILKNKYTGYSFNLKDTKQSLGINQQLYSYETNPSSVKDAAQREKGYYRGEARHIMNICEIEDYWSDSGSSGFHAGFVGLTARWCSYRIIFPKKSNYNLEQIQKIYAGADSNGNSRINVSITYKKTTQPVRFMYKPNSTPDPNEGTVYNISVEDATEETVEGDYNIASEFNKSNFSNVSATASIKDKNNVKTVSLNYDSATDTYSCTLTLQDYVKYYNRAAAYKAVKNGEYVDVGIYMNVYTHEPQKIKVTFYGDKLETKSDDIVFEYAINSPNVLKLDDNEIMQTNSKIDGANYENYVKNSIMNVWSDGLETAELRCSISDYSDYFTKVKTKSVIDKDKEMLFKNGDVVIPMVATPTGDKPMSQYSDSLPKRFMVMSTGVSYDGALWQKLILQEYRQRFRVITNAQYGSKITASNYAPVLGEEVIISVEPSKYYSITKITINGEEKNIRQNDGYNEYQIVCSTDITIVAEAEYVGQQWHVVPIKTGQYITIGDITYQYAAAQIDKTSVESSETRIYFSDINSDLEKRGIDNSGNTRITAYVDTTAYGGFTLGKVTKKLLVQDRTILANERTNTGTAVATTPNNTEVSSYIQGDFASFICSMDVKQGDQTSAIGYGEVVWKIVKIEQFY